jgi:hypothetical protein
MKIGRERKKIGQEQQLLRSHWVFASSPVDMSRGLQVLSGSVRVARSLQMVLPPQEHSTNVLLMILRASYHNSQSNESRNALVSLDLVGC